MKLLSAVRALSALAQEARLTVFRLLVASGDEGKCAGEIAEELGILKPTLSFHLKELSHAQLIVAERFGRRIRYRANNPAIRQLMGYLMEECCGGRPELCFPRPATATRGDGNRRTRRQVPGESGNRSDGAVMGR